MSEEGGQHTAELSLPGEGPADLPGRRRTHTLELLKCLAAAWRSEAAAPDQCSSGKP